MNTLSQETNVTRGFAGPVPLGFVALGLSLAMFGAYNIGQVPPASFPAAGTMLFLGGGILAIAAILAFCNSDGMSLTLFGVLSAFWIMLGILFLVNAFGHPLEPLMTGSAFTWFWFFWAVTASYLWLASMRTNGVEVTFVGTVAAMLWCLWIGQLTAGRPGVGWDYAAGWVAWAAAAIAGYTGLAEMVNHSFGRLVLPEFGGRPLEPVST
jgi:succinate-acetate transporter protein